MLKPVLTATTPRVSQRSALVSPFIVMDVMTEAATIERAGGSIVHMEVGQPGHPAPRVAREAAAKALAAGSVGYTEALGIWPLRERIARHYRDWYGVSVEPQRVVVTTGSSGGFTLAFLSMFDPGQRVAISSPGYPAYRNILKALGLEVVEIPTGADTRYALSGAAIAAAHAEKPLAGVLAMSPANPTGVVMAPEAIADLSATCRKLGIAFISDEIYHGLTYERPAETALRFDADTVIINSFSKFFCMTGWRVGWIVSPPALVRPIERLQQNLSISVPYLSQIAALAAFDGHEEMVQVRQGYARNRAILMQELPRLGLGSFLPIDGAFYVYTDVSGLSNDSMDFCRRAIREAGVAITPGLDFDPENGHRFARLSFAGTEADMIEAVKRLGAWLG
ncbi:MAG: aminotransferase class I/II-fold pyridoxal phosphate-dependent enzyme [Hyphomicrobiales bacterium]|nr:aminotransferase class I/II-fold pyridoxal phosphate-dependent enzyme [Hyphomicrobiales bacterium]